MALISKRDRPVFPGATYLGGLAEGPRRSAGNLTFDESVTIGTAWQKVEIPATEVASVDTGSELVGKRRTGAVLAFGVLGLAGRGTKTEGSIVISLRSGEEAYFMVPKFTDVKIKAALAGWMAKHAIAWTGEIEDDAPDAGSPSKADEIEKLARLRADGILTEKEFSAAKADLLGLGD